MMAEGLRLFNASSFVMRGRWAAHWPTASLHNRGCRQLVDTVFSLLPLWDVGE